MNEQQRHRARLWAAAQSDDDLRAALDENISLRAQLADLRGENAALQIRLAAALERGRKMREHRPRDIRGLLASVRDAINGRS